MRLADTLARVAAIADQQQARAESDRDTMRRDYPGAAQVVAFVQTRFGRPPWVRDCASGREWGTRTERIVPPVPGIPGGRVEASK